MRQAHEELGRPAGALLLSGFSAGLDLGFGPFLMAVSATLTSKELPHSVTQMLISLRVRRRAERDAARALRGNPGGICAFLLPQRRRWLCNGAQ
ncbi:MAG TPA: hypothetical protein VI653_05880, partial [Steroidobacteraceae bacterium]